MTRTAVVHIGTEKTGTTTIQHFLRLNRELLAKQGIGVPDTLGPITHTRLATFAQSSGADENAGREAILTAQRQQFEDEMSWLPKAITRVMFSSEHLHRRLETLEQVQRLRDILAKHFDEIRILVYLRRQDRLAASLYSTKIRYGASWGLPVLPGKRARQSHYYNYRVLLEKYIQVFGQENIKVRLFEKKRLSRGDVLRDYCEAVDIDFDRNPAPDTKNESLSPAALMVLGTLNERAPQRGEVLIKEHYIRLLEQNFSSSQQLAPRHEAMQFYNWFAESNAWVHETFFPDLEGALFDEDFSAYPDQKKRPEPELREALPVFGTLWEAQRAQRHALEQRVAVLEAALREAGLTPPAASERPGRTARGRGAGNARRQARASRP